MWVGAGGRGVAPAPKRHCRPHRCRSEFHFRGAANRLIRDKGEEDSQFEGIAYMPENNTFLLLKEAVEHGGHPHYHPHIVHARLTPDSDSWEEIQQCKIDFEISSANKGFESVVYTRDGQGRAYLMGLCEGNHCKARGRQLRHPRGGVGSGAGGPAQQKWEAPLRRRRARSHAVEPHQSGRPRLQPSRAAPMAKTAGMGASF